MHWRHGLGAAAVALLASLGARARAQESMEVLTAPVAEARPAEPEPDEDRTEPMAWLGVGLKLGLGTVEPSEVELDISGIATPKKIDRRSGLQVSIPINLGGDGFGWLFEPYLNLDAEVSATGLYTGPTINIQILDPLYVGVGFGLKFALLSSDALDRGIDLGGRVPVSATYYILNDLGLIAEFGLGYTGSALKYDKSIDPKGEFNLGYAVAWDFSLGLRWP